jgi:hypothetical protein
MTGVRDAQNGRSHPHCWPQENTQRLLTADTKHNTKRGGSVVDNRKEPC